MLQKICTAIVVFLWLSLQGLTSLAFAVEAALSAPVKCNDAVSCGDDLTLAEAMDAYKAVASKRVKKPKKMKDRIDHVDRKKGVTTLYCSTDRNICDSSKCRGDYYYWAPVERFQNGAAAFALLLDRARDGRPFNGHVIVASSDSTADEQHLALCDVTQVRGIAGPPKNCVTVAIITPSSTWLRGGTPMSICPAMASIRKTGAIDIDFLVHTRGGPARFSTALQKILGSELNLTIERNEEKDSNGKVSSIYLKCASGLQDSKILTDWREVLDFDIRLHSDKEGIGISGTAHPLVCRQALGNLSQYQGLNDAQRNAYGYQLNSMVNKAIKAACKHYRQIDDKTISCD